MLAHPILGQKHGFAAEPLSPLVRVDGDVPDPPRGSLSWCVRRDPQIPDGFAVGDYVVNKVIVLGCPLGKVTSKGLLRTGACLLSWLPRAN